MDIKRLAVGEIEANCYILRSEDEIVVIDPGDEGERIAAEVRKTPGRLKYIVNTHHHFDHTDACEAVKKACGGESLIHEKESGYIDFLPDRWLREGEEIGFGDECLKVLHTPGHSEGSICLLGNGLIFTGDTVFLNGYGRIDLPGGSPDDMERSLIRLSGIIKPGMMVYPGHGDSYER